MLFKELITLAKGYLPVKFIPIHLIIRIVKFKYFSIYIYLSNLGID